MLERSINLLENHGVEQITINVHHLADQIEKFILNFKSKVKITISNEKDLLLDTGGGVKEGTKSFGNNPFFILNPDTLWLNDYLVEMQSLEKIYNKSKKPCLLLVNKRLSFDTTFKGDFNLKITLSPKILKMILFLLAYNCSIEIILDINKKIFSMNEVWKNLIDNNKLMA